MPDALYNVAIRLTQEGGGGPFSSDTLSKAAQLEGHLSRTREHGTRFGETMASAFNGAIERANSLSDRVVDVGMGIAKWGATGALGLVTLGVAKLNNEFEQTQISLASIFNANGVSKNMTEGLGVAAGLMKTMRKDAAALPGETSDLLGIFRSVSIPGLRAGKDVNQLEKFSANVMAAGASSGLDMATVAREAGQLVAGRAGAHNILGSTLFGLTGNDAQAFNAKSAAARFEFLSEGMKKYGAAIDTYGRSFAGLSSSLYDNSKNYLRLATEPVFEKVKDSMSKVSSWMTAHDGEIQSMMQRVGISIADAFLRGEQVIVKWTPAVIRFAEVTEQRVLGVFHKLEPIIERVERMLGNALSDPDRTLDKMGRVFELGAAMKFAGPLGSLAEAGLGAAGVGAGTAGVAAAGVAAAGAFDVYAMTRAVQTSDFAAGQWTAITERSGETISHLTHIMTELEPAADAVVSKMGEGMLFVLNRFVSQADAWITAIDTIGTKADSFFRDRMPMALEIGFGKIFDEANVKNRSIVKHFENDEVGSFRHTKSAVGDYGAAQKNLTGGGGTVINMRIEMPINTNGDPNRVARAVVDHLNDLRRHPTSSKHSRNFSTER